MEYKSDRSKVEIRENEIFSKNNSFFRGSYNQTIEYNKINKVKKFKWSFGKNIFYSFGVYILLIWSHKIIFSSLICGFFIILGIRFNSKFGRNISLYLKYNIGSKKVSRSIYTTESSQEIDEIIEKITSKL